MVNAEGGGADGSGMDMGVQYLRELCGLDGTPWPT